MIRPPPVDEDAPLDAFGAPPYGPTEMPGGGGMDDEMEMPDDEAEGIDMEAAMAELDEAEGAGDDFAGQSFFAPVPGTEDAAAGETGGAMAGGADPAMQREVLEQLLASLPQ